MYVCVSIVCVCVCNNVCILVPICYQIIKRSGEGILATDGVGCLAEDTCNLHHLIFIQKKCATEKAYHQGLDSHRFCLTWARLSQGKRPTQIQTSKLQNILSVKENSDIKIFEFEIFKTSTIKFKTHTNLLPNVKQGIIPNTKNPLKTQKLPITQNFKLQITQIFN